MKRSLKLLSLVVAMFLIAAFVLSSSPAWGQAQNGSISGVVTDSSGAVVGSAKVAVTSLTTGSIRTTQTTAEGDYTVQQLPPEDYKVVVTAPGFATSSSTLNVSVGSANTVNVKLTVGNATVTVEVAANSVSGINLENAENSQVIASNQMTEFPTESRDPYDFVSLSGNVSTDPSNGPNGASRGVGVNISGSRSASTEILLDGIENTYLFSVGVGTPVPVDAVQEYRVITSNYGPEYGRASGGVVNVVTKSGTNQFHGTMWEFYRPSTFAAQSTYNKANGIPLNRFVRNEFGFVVGGPVIKDKLFFFGGNEWLRVRSSNVTQFYVPAASFISKSSAATQAFFTQYGTLSATPVGNPLTLGQVGGGPGALTSSFATDRTKLETNFPTQFNDSTPIFQLVQETAFSDAGGGSPQNTYNTIGRIDFNMSQTTQMYGRYVLYNQVTPVGTQNVSPYAGYNTADTTKAQDLVYGLTHSFSQALTSQLQIGLVRVNQNEPLGANPAGPTLFINETSFSVGGISVVGPGYSATSASVGLPSGGPQNDIVISPVVTYTKGRHTMTFGGQYTYIRDNHTFPIYDNAQESLSTATTGALVNFQAGVFNFFQANIDPQGKFPCAKSLTTGATPGAGNSTNGTAAFDPTCTITTPLNPPVFGRSNRYQEGAWFANDSWKITPRLTINVGIRYELFGTQHNKNSALDSNFYPGTTGSLADRIRAGKILNVNATAPAGVQSPNGKLWKTNYKQFAPRIGFAYDLTGDGRTSLRGGYGISYERNFGNVTYNVALNPPGQFAISLTNADNGGVSFPISTGILGPFGSIAGIQKALPQASARAVDPNMKPAYNQFYTLAIERQINSGFAVGVNYTGERGIHNYSIANYNRLYYGQVYENDPALWTKATGSPASLKNTNRLNPQYTGINIRGADGDSYYNGLNVSVRANNLYKTGLTLTANYTYAHSTDNSSSTFASDGGSNGALVGGVSYFDPFNHGLDRGSSDFDVKHRIALGFIYTTPAFGTSGFTRDAVQGWEIGTQFVAYTGTPFTMYDSNLATSGNGIYARAHFNVPVHHQRVRKSTAVADSPDFYDYIDFPDYNSTNYAQYGDPKLGYSDMPTMVNGIDTFGNMSSRNAFRGPGAQTLNADLIKNFKVTERFGLQFRAELFNVLNHPNEYLNLDGSNDVGSTTYIETYKNVGPFTSDNRQLQLAGKITF